MKKQIFKDEIDINCANAVRLEEIPCTYEENRPKPTRGLRGNNGPRGPQGNMGNPGGGFPIFDKTSIQKLPTMMYMKQLSVKLRGVGIVNKQLLLEYVENAPKGPVGFPGVTGTPGKPGKTGFTGVIGQEGKQGKMGPPGPKGILGLLGPPGDKGSIGHKGNMGYPGLSGQPGEPGNAGTPGNPGRVTASCSASAILPGPFPHPKCCKNGNCNNCLKEECKTCCASVCKNCPNHKIQRPCQPEIPKCKKPCSIKDPNCPKECAIDDLDNPYPIETDSSRDSIKPVIGVINPPIITSAPIIKPPRIIKPPPVIVNPIIPKRTPLVTKPHITTLKILYTHLTYSPLTNICPKIKGFKGLRIQELGICQRLPTKKPKLEIDSDILYIIPGTEFRRKSSLQTRPPPMPEDIIAINQIFPTSNECVDERGSNGLLIPDPDTCPALPKSLEELEIDCHEYFVVPDRMVCQGFISLPPLFTVQSTTNPMISTLFNITSNTLEPGYSPQPGDKPDPLTTVCKTEDSVITTSLISEICIAPPEEIEVIYIDKEKTVFIKQPGLIDGGIHGPDPHITSGPISPSDSRLCETPGYDSLMLIDNGFCKHPNLVDDSLSVDNDRDLNINKVYSEDDLDDEPYPMPVRKRPPKKPKKPKTPINDKPKPVVPVRGPNPVVPARGPNPVVPARGPNPVVHGGGPKPAGPGGRPNPVGPAVVNRPTPAKKVTKPKPIVQTPAPRPVPFKCDGKSNDDLDYNNKNGKCKTEPIKTKNEFDTESKLMYADKSLYDDISKVGEQLSRSSRSASRLKKQASGSFDRLPKSNKIKKVTTKSPRRNSLSKKVNTERKIKLERREIQLLYTSIWPGVNYGILCSIFMVEIFMKIYLMAC